MEVNILKSGPWAFKGIKVMDIKEGLQDIGKEIAEELIFYGWAESPKKEAVEIVEVLEKPKNIVESIEKKKAGWWYVKFEGRKEIVKVRGANNEGEAIILALAELEVE